MAKEKAVVTRREWRAQWRKVFETNEYSQYRELHLVHAKTGNTIKLAWLDKTEDGWQMYEHSDCPFILSNLDEKPPRRTLAEARAYILQDVFSSVVGLLVSLSPQVVPRPATPTKKTAKAVSKKNR